MGHTTGMLETMSLTNSESDSTANIGISVSAVFSFLSTFKLSCFVAQMSLSSSVVFHRYRYCSQYCLAVNGSMVPVMKLLNDGCDLCQWLAAVGPHMYVRYMELCGGVLSALSLRWDGTE